MVKLSKYILGLLLPMLALSACSKMESGMDDMIQVLPPVEEEKAPSKYQEGDLVSMVFTVEESEETKITLGEPGSGITGGSSRRVSWNEEDSVMFVWGPDAEDCCIGVAQKTDVKTDFKVEKIFKDAKTVYAVTPASAYHSFVKSANWDTDGTGTVKVDIRKQGGSFEDAYIAVARTSLETRKMRFKTLCGYVAVNPTNYAFGGFRLTSPSASISGVIPVTATMDGDYTGILTLGDLEEGSTVVTATKGAYGQKAFIAVVPDTDFKDGIALTYLDAYGVAIGEATLKNKTSVAKNQILEFASSLNKYFSKDIYVKANASGSADGSSWEKAWNLTQLSDYLNTKDKVVSSETEGLSADASLNIHIAAGTYQPTATINFYPIWAKDDKSSVRKLNFMGGYPSDISNANAASKLRDPQTHETVFSGASAQLAKDISMMYVAGPSYLSLSGLVLTGMQTTQTGAVALYIKGEKARDTRTEVLGCTFKENVNKGVGAGMVVYVDTDPASNINDVKVQQCQFLNNRSGGGSAINFDGIYADAAITDCYFEGNYAKKYSTSQDSGGAVKFTCGSATLTRCTFKNNYVDETAYGNGGAVWISDEHISTHAHKPIATFNECDFIGNYTENAYGKGGAVYVQRYNGAIFNDCTFTGNYCKYGTGANHNVGGAMAIGNYPMGTQTHAFGIVDVSLNRCTFSGNYLDSKEGEGTSNVGRAVGGGCIFLHQPDANTATSLHVNGCTFEKNYPEMIAGGVIYANSGTLEINDSDFTDNSNAIAAGASNEGKTNVDEMSRIAGSVLYIKDAAVTITNSNFEDNRTSGGGTVFLSGNNCSFTMAGGNFTNNKSYGAGAAALRVSSNFNSPTYPERVVSVNGVTFTGNHSTGGYGGAVAIYKNTNANFTNCAFKENRSPHSFCGALYVSGEDEAANTITCTNCEFNKNYSKRGGGAICISQKGNQAYTDSTASTPAYTLDATAYYQTCETSLKLNNCSFTGNYTTKEGGGALHLQTSGTVDVQGCTFSGNYTQNPYWFNSGGAVSLAFGNVSTNTYKKNSVVKGIVQNPKPGDFSFTGCTFKGNHTKSRLKNDNSISGYDTYYDQDNGGAIMISRGTRIPKDGANDNYSNNGDYFSNNPCLVKIYQCNFVGNYSTQAGAISCRSAQSNTYISNCLFYKNYVTYAIAPDIRRYQGAGLFINNSTFYYGWALGAWNTANINIDDGDFVFANSTLISTNRSAENTYDNDENEGLIRFDGINGPEAKKLHFINSIICNTRKSSGSGLAFTGWHSNVVLSETYPSTSARSFITVASSGHLANFGDPANTTDADFFYMTFEGEKTFRPGSSLEEYGTSDYFGNLKWNCDESNPTYENSYWSWNGTRSSGKGLSKLVNMNNDLNNTAPEFYTWLNSVGAIGVDQRGKARGTYSYLGAYDGTNVN